MFKLQFNGHIILQIVKEHFPSFCYCCMCNHGMYCLKVFSMFCFLFFLSLLSLHYRKQFYNKREKKRKKEKFPSVNKNIILWEFKCFPSWSAVLFFCLQHQKLERKVQLGKWNLHSALNLIFFVLLYWEIQQISNDFHVFLQVFI